MKNQILNFFFRITQTSVWQIFIQRPLSVKRGWTAALNRLSLFYVVISFGAFIPIYFDTINNPPPKSLNEMRVDVGILSNVTPSGRRSIGSFQLKNDQGEYLDYAYIGRELNLYKGKQFKVYSKEEINMFGFKRQKLKPYELVNLETGEIIKKFDYELRFDSNHSIKNDMLFFFFILALLTLRLFIKYRK